MGILKILWASEILVEWFQLDKSFQHKAIIRIMREDLKRLLIERLLIDDTVADRRVNYRDRRRLNTYIFCDRRSGLADKRSKTPELIKRLIFGHRCERRRANSDRRKLNTFIMKDRRSGIADRRSGS